MRRGRGLDPGALAAALDELEARVVERLAARHGEAGIRRIAAMRYVGQAFELPVEVDPGTPDAASIAALALRFEDEHARSYGLRLGFGVEIVALEVTATLAGEGEVALAASAPRRDARARDVATRRAYFGPAHGHAQTPVASRAALAATPRQGPLVVEDYEGTTVVPPDASAWLDAHGNIVIELAGSPA
jgi:N-methylhydantoinase A